MGKGMGDIFRRVVGAAATSAGKLAGSAADGGRGPFTFEIPERPVFSMPESVYRDAEEKAERWQGLRREIEESKASELKKAEALKGLGEREAKDGVSLEADMDKLQDEIAALRRKREKAEVRLEPAIHAAWRAALEADDRASKAIDDYWRGAGERYEKEVTAVRDQLQGLLEALETRLTLSMGHPPGHTQRQLGLPETTGDFMQRLARERDEAEKIDGAVVEETNPPVAAPAEVARVEGAGGDLLASMRRAIDEEEDR